MSKKKAGVAVKATEIHSDKGKGEAPRNATNVKDGNRGWLSKATALGVGMLAIASAVLFSNQQAGKAGGAAKTTLHSMDKDAPLLRVSEIRARRTDLGCKNRHKDSECDSFASRGDCPAAPGWMAVMCAASCDACDLLNPDVRCDASRIGYEPVDAWQAGSLNELFEKLPERFPEFNITFLSRPPAGPYVARFENFISDQETEALLEETMGLLRRSTDQGDFDENGVQEQVVSHSRTSENAWCSDECEQNPMVLAVTERIEAITGIPSANYESFQVLRYRKGQEYRRHHDSSEEDNELLSGPRILTFFLYLSDIEEGGGTSFTDLTPPVTNHPKKGTAILWPSVLDEDPTKVDSRTHHAALPVIKGTKFAANHWIHLRDYKTPNLWGCTGSFSEIESED